jgi:DNA-binding CsgD family transcriptional regulator
MEMPSELDRALRIFRLTSERRAARQPSKLVATDSLTLRERKVGKLLANGRSNREIATGHVITREQSRSMSSTS